MHGPKHKRQPKAVIKRNELEVEVPQTNLVPVWNVSIDITNPSRDLPKNRNASGKANTSTTPNHDRLLAQEIGDAAARNEPKKTLSPSPSTTILFSWIQDGSLKQPFRIPPSVATPVVAGRRVRRGLMVYSCTHAYAMVAGDEFRIPDVRFPVLARFFRARRFERIQN